MLYLTVLLIFVCIFSLFYLILSYLFVKERSIEKLKYFEAGMEREEKLEQTNNRVSPLKAISKMIPKIQRSKQVIDKLELELIRADLPITTEELRTIRLLSSSALAFLAFALFKNLVLVVVVFLLVWKLPGIIINKKKKERLTMFHLQLGEGIMIISNSLKAGYSFLQAVAVSADEMKNPFAKEFRKLLKEMSLGIEEEVALKNMLNRMPSDELRLIMNAVLIQRDIGGNLSEILDNISETLRERQKMKEELKTLMAQGKLSGIIVSLLPVFLGLFIFLLNHSYMITLFTTPLGLGMVAVAVMNELIGLCILRKIVNIEM